MGVKPADFSGYATKANLECTDGRTILPNAFSDQHGTRVPLIWKHQHDDPKSVLGHAILESRDDGMYAHCFFNNGEKAAYAKEAVVHGDITRMSIYANKLVQNGAKVLRGAIREVSLVLSGANPGAQIDNVAIQHGDDVTFLDEAIITTGLSFSLSHADEDDEDDKKDDKSNKKEDEMFDVREQYESMTEDQKTAVNVLVTAAATAAMKHDDENDLKDSSTDESIDHQEGTSTMSNVFDGRDKTNSPTARTLSHDDMATINKRAIASGSLKEAVEEYSLQHGIEDIDILFPDAKNVGTTPDFLARRTEWVSEVVGASKHTPFARIKSFHADLTLDKARAKGYIKAAMKREEFFKVSKRVTTPQTIYKKQKLDRDDIVDITDFDVVVWVKGEMRFMMDEEIARAVLLGDGRSHEDEDKIDPENIRPIAFDHDLYATKVNVNISDASSSLEEVVDATVLNRRHYRGSGNPTFFTTEEYLSGMLLIKDTLGRRLYPTVADLASAMRCSKIVPVEAMDDEAYGDIIGIMVNMQDYTIGADRGGELNMFDDFDIDYNQFKYLLETRISGALTKLKSAIVFRKVAAALVEHEPAKPVRTNNVIAIPTDTKVAYTLNGAPAAQGADSNLIVGDNIVVASATAGYFFENGPVTWTYTRNV